MVKSSVACNHEWTIRESRWPYDEYYIGNRDEDDRRNGQGENHWTGAESIEWYTGQFLRDTMHGDGDYRWRYQHPDGAFTTYEGKFFANQMHGYGVMSYADGRVFTGLFYKDVRWGPGVCRLLGLRCNVGLWRGTQLARMTWCPHGPSITPDFNAGPKGPAFLDDFRVILARKTRIIGQTNSALELLKQSGCDPQIATKLWPKLYPKTCNDLDSVLCYKDAFEREYYKGKVRSLEEVSDGPKSDDSGELIGEDTDENNEPIPKAYFAWNNNAMIRHMMKHTYQHEAQRARFKVDLERILNGSRKLYRLAGKHEYDCRTLLMASYLGHILNVAQLINEEYVYPDVCDMQGNTAMMYATCGDQTDIIRFLVEAGANVDSFNDSCCTPLAMALIRYLCLCLDIGPMAIVQTLLPPAPPKAEKGTVPEERKATEWLIKREQVCQNVIEPTKVTKSASVKKLKSTGSLAKTSTTAIKKKSVFPKPRTSLLAPEYNSDDEVFTEDKRMFVNIAHEYEIRVNNVFMNAPTAKGNIASIFQVNDMMREISEAEGEFQKAMATTTDKHPKKSVSKTAKDTVKGKEIWEDIEKDQISLTSGEKLKLEMQTRIQFTVLQLLADGADPKMVRCPQPAILLAMKSGSTELVQHIVAHGADINEKFPEFLDYTALDIVISEPLSPGNVDMIKTMLELGADVHHRLHSAELLQSASMLVNVTGPTLMHAVLAKKTEFDFEEDIRSIILELLLRYNADPSAQYNGRSPIDFAMLKRVDLLEVFIKSGSNLNTIINDKNQTILVKMFSEEYFRNPNFSHSPERVPVLTDLLLYGADPLIECYDGEDKFGNIFEFAKKTLNIIAPAPAPAKQSAVEVVEKPKGKGKDAKDAKKPTKEKSRSATEVGKKKSIKDNQESLDYLEALDLMRECARLLHTRWLQAKLMKELINVIYKFKHRPWNMIIKEHKNGSNVGLWLTTLRCLEIWEVLKTTKRKQYNNERILKHLLCIVQFYQKRLKARLSILPPMTAMEKNTIESDVGYLIKEHKNAAALAKEAEAWKKLYVKPELDYKADNKFQVCFECSLRLTEESIICDSCDLVSFCNLECMHQNVERANCHPCSEYLAEKYFPPVE
ncbi:ankyrin repeat and MYND domain-containing protein 1-like [Pectinophora gossypiella]|uniref:ankyrin repeat and MYND domain-containing protein 1-like n=1 Tax=Pectinophora gossypiella TaxID=13191 RepID=UPI00214F497B|nr:ankyrin repeat and MYND domain-containing protein 1-like [Pectinophora gossypiella]